MFEKLSSALKKATDKIANAIFLDKSLVDSIIKELQRALIEADVNVQLVKSLSDKIRQSALDERIKNVEKKEHIIKLLHDELIIMLGGDKKEIQLSKKTKILLLGLYGQGKCVHGESNIQLSDGDIIKAKKLYEEYKRKFPEENLEDGDLINIEKENLQVPSFNSRTAKIENKKVTHLWRLNKEELIELKLDNGNDYSIKVTPEHPFFALRNGQIQQIRADEITEQDYIATPQKIKIEGKTISLFEDIKKLDLAAYLTSEEVKGILKNKSIKEICKNLNFSRNYCQLTSDLKKGIIPIELINSNKNFMKIKEHNAKDAITMPLFLTSEFVEFIGYVMSDGHIEKKYIEIVTEDQEIIKRLTELSKLLFNISPKVRRDLRTNKMYIVLFCSKTLVEVFKIFGLNPGKKGVNLQIPKQILLSNEDVIKSFIKAYFDCDSSPSNLGRQIELISESKILIKQIDFLLKRFGIFSSISKKTIKNKEYGRLRINGRFAEIYATKIGFTIKHKQKRADKFYNFGLIQGSGRQNMIPLGSALKELRKQLGFSIGEIQSNAVNSYGRYEQAGFISKEQLTKLLAYYRLKKIGIYFQLLNDINHKENLIIKYRNSFVNGIITYLKDENIANFESNKLVLREKGKQQLEQINPLAAESLINNFEALCNSDICWTPIKSISKTKNDEKVVYDLTVEDNHSFIAEGFIVHNTTTISKLALYYQKRGRKVACLGLDVHRPAATDQLEQLCNKLNIPCFIDKKEKNPIKIYKSFQDELDKYDLLLIDTAGRDALSKDLIEELEKLEKTIKPDYKILVMSADIGQSAKKQADEFKKVGVNGVIITRMDSTAKGGGALTACHETNSPVFFIGTGEKAQDLEQFNPASFISRMLGMGDLQGLIEKVKSASSGNEDKLKKRLDEGKFTLLDLYEQLKSMNSLGSLDKIIELIPGLGNKVPKEMLGTQESKMKKWKNAIDSMTLEEIENPELLEKQTSRLGRIAKGSGTTTSEIRTLIKQYKMLKELVKGGDIANMEPGAMNQAQMMKLAKKFGRKMKF
jgi:signal recognition particle subunit SRP54